MLTAWLLISMTQVLVTESMSLGELPEPSWNTSAVVGVGSADESVVGLIRPRLSIEGDFARLQLSSPLWLAFGDSQPSLSLGPDWGSVYTYLDMIESFVLTSQAGHLRLSLGTLHQESLGSGALVDGYSASWSPLHYNVGASTEIRFDGVEVRALLNQLEAPTLMAISTQVRPMWWLGDVDAERFVLSAELAVASGDSAAQADGESLIAGDFGARLVFHSGQFLQVEGMLTGVFLNQQRFGAHLALLVEWLGQAPLWGDSVAVQVDLIKAWSGYLPGYFGPLYDIQRHLEPRASSAPYFTQVKVNSKQDNLRYGAKLTYDFEGELDVDMYARWMQQQWSAMVLLHQSQFSSLKEIGRENSPFWAEMEVAVSIYEQLYTYGQLVRGWDFQGSTPRPLTVWTLGLGAHFGGKFTQQ